MELLFAICAGILAYTFLGYPLLAFLISRIRRRPVLRAPQYPAVTFIISAYNEQAVIAEKIENTLALEYPRHLLSIIVLSDGSTDATDQIVARYESQGVRLLRVDGRRGKTYCQNRAVEISTGDILVFSDANSMYDPSSVRELVANFSDPHIGVVCGELRYRKRPGTEEGLYWNIETLLKTWESAIDSCLGVNGSMYAIRRSAFVPLPDYAQSDFVEPFMVYRQGYRVIYDPAAFCIEEPASNHGEYDRKVRIVHGALRNTVFLAGFLNPFRYGWYSVTLWSHKVIRWFMPVFLIGTFVSSAFLVSRPVYCAIFLAQAIIYGLGLLGRFVPGRIFSLPYYLLLINTASLVAIANLILGKPVETWEPVRSR